MQSETDAAVMVHKNPFVHNKPLHFCNSEGHTKNTLQKMWKSVPVQHSGVIYFPRFALLLLRGFSLVAVVMEECHISL